MLKFWAYFQTILFFLILAAGWIVFINFALEALGRILEFFE